MSAENPIDSSPINTRAVPLHDEISRRAREIWEESGRPQGRDLEFWLKAELEVLGADGSIKIEGAGAVFAEQYTATTDANAAKRKSGAGRK